MKLNTTIRNKSIHIHVGSIWIRQNMNYPKFITFFLGYNVNTNRQALKIRKGGGWNKGTCTSTKVFFSVIFLLLYFLTVERWWILTIDASWIWLISSCAINYCTFFLHKCNCFNIVGYSIFHFCEIQVEFYFVWNFW